MNNFIELSLEEMQCINGGGLFGDFLDNVKSTGKALGKAVGHVAGIIKDIVTHPGADSQTLMNCM